MPKIQGIELQTFPENKLREIGACFYEASITLMPKQDLDRIRKK